MFFEIYKQGNLIIRGKRILNDISIDNELMTAPSTTILLPIDWIQVINGREEVKIYLDKYILGLQRIYKTTLEKVILYGSYARGDYTEDSDIDIMILLNISDMEIKNYRELLSELTYEFNTNYNLDIKPIAKSKEEFLKWINAYPFYANVQKEGIELFK